MIQATRKLSKQKSNPSIPSKELDQKLRDVVAEFVKKYGIITLLDVCQGTINKALVRKGIFTSGELRDAYMEDVTKAMRREDRARAMAKSVKIAK